MIVTDGLIAYYNSKQGVDGSTWKNISPNTLGQYNAQINGATVTPEGMYFDGVDDYIDIGVLDTSGAHIDFSIEIYANLEINGEYSDILVPTNTSLPYSLYQLFQSVNSIVWAIPSSAGGWLTPEIETPYSTGHLTLTYRASNRSIQIYINGSLVNTVSVSQDRYLLRWALRLGSNESDNPKGIIDYVRFYNKVLTPQEVQQNYKIGAEIGLTYSENENTVAYDLFDRNDGLIGVSNSGHTWEMLGDYEFYITDGKAHGEIGYNDNNMLAVIETGIKNGEIMASFSSTSMIDDQGSMGLAFRIMDENNFYSVEYTLNNWWLYQTVNSEKMPLSATSLFDGGSLSIPINVKVIFDNDKITWYLNGVEIETVIVDEFMDSTRHGISMNGGEYGRIDDFIVESREVPIIDNIPPAEVSNLSETHTDKTATISWINPIDIDFHHVEIYKDDILIISNYNGISYQDIYLSPLTSYEYKIITVDNTGNKSKGVTISVTTREENKIVTMPPIVNIFSIDKTKISNQPNMDTANIEFRFGFDQDVQSWQIRINGVDHTTGILATNGGFIKNGTELLAEIHWSLLYEEGENRVNIYGQGLDGSWTPYHDERNIAITKKVTLGTRKYGYVTYGRH